MFVQTFLWKNSQRCSKSALISGSALILSVNICLDPRLLSTRHSEIQIRRTWVLKWGGIAQRPKTSTGAGSWPGCFNSFVKLEAGQEVNFVKGRSEQKGDLESPGFASIFTNSAPNKIKNDKSCDLFKLVSVLLSASVERVGVSRMRDFSYQSLDLSWQTHYFCTNLWICHLKLIICLTISYNLLKQVTDTYVKLLFTNQV